MTKEQGQKVSGYLVTSRPISRRKIRPRVIFVVVVVVVVALLPFN